MEDELVQYYIVNEELNMSSGKIAAQVAHVATDIALEQGNISNPICELFWAWHDSNNQKKIILRGHEKDLIKLKEQGCYYIEDIGLTEISPNSLTCIGLGVMRKSEAQKYIKRLQLL